jgi:hypothetical protein
LSIPVRGVFGPELVRYSSEVIINPELALEGDQKQLIVDKLTPLTAQGFMTTATENLRHDVSGHVFACDRLRIDYDVESRDPIAFTAADVRHTKCGVLYYLSGMIVDPRFHGSGFAYSILREDLGVCQADVLAFHTQSGLMYGLGEKVSDFDGELAKDLAAEIGTRNLASSVIGPIDRGRYGGKSLYGDTDKFELFALKGCGFDYRNGDAIVFVGRIKKGSI